MLPEVAATLIIIPARGEHDTLAAVVDGIAADIDADVVVLDGGGNGTASWRRRGVEVLPVPRGNGRAVRAGLGLAVERGYERVLRLDGDGQHVTDVVPALLNALSGADMVLGTRFGPGADLAKVPLDRLLLNVALRDLISNITGMKFDDVVSGCWGIRRRVFAPLHRELTTDDYGITIEILVRLLCGARAEISQVPIPAVYHGSARMQAKYDPSALSERNKRAGEYFTVLTRVLTELGLGTERIIGGNA